MRTQRFSTAALTASPTSHKPYARLRTLARTVAVAVFLMAAVPLHAAAAPCGPLLASFVSFLNEPGVNGVQFLQTTNYQAHGYWKTGHSWGYLDTATGGPILAGTVYRNWDYGGTETFTIEFYANGPKPNTRVTSRKVAHLVGHTARTSC